MRGLGVVCAVVVAGVAGAVGGLARGQATGPAGTLPRLDYDVRGWKHRDFAVFDPTFEKDLAARVARVMPLVQQVIDREKAGQNTELSHQLLVETLWLISATADFKEIDKEMDELVALQAHPEREKQAEEEDPRDGSWGIGYDRWFLKLRATYPRLEKAKYPLHFIDRINSPEKLSDYLKSVEVSDIARTGVDNEEEYNESLSDVMRMILRHNPDDYAYDPGLKDRLMELLLHELRDPATGYWGEKYIHDGKAEFVDDLSITFHVVSYLNGDVPDMDKVVATTLAAEDMEFPVGPLYKGQRYDHLNMDVAEIFRLGWAKASAEQKRAMAAELDKLLTFCLTESLQPDGSFKMWVGDFSKEESTYYGASFLGRIGYFDKSKRFWTDREFPDAEKVRQKILAYIRAHMDSGATGGEYYRGALESLGEKVGK
ncbi:MAG TPA: hypothetical protein VHQ47_16760 [Phycisphaerae bacterium]|nr:hypothetical protein [Phycisphaerae bacterium]